MFKILTKTTLSNNTEGKLFVVVVVVVVENQASLASPANPLSNDRLSGRILIICNVVTNYIVIKLWFAVGGHE